MPSELTTVLDREALHALFQPIVDRRTRAPVGYEGLIRGPVGTDLHMPGPLFATAIQEHRRPELERAALGTVLKAFARLHHPERLFVNVRPETLLDWQGFVPWLERTLARHGLDPHDLVIELSEHGLTTNEDGLLEAVAVMRSMGCDIALDDLGAGSSGLKTWALLRPDFVKVDRYFIAGIESDPVRGEILRSVVDMACALGCRVIAEGVENAAQCAMVLDLGVDHLQGYLLGEPQAVPQLAVSALESLHRAAGASTADCAEDLLIAVPPVVATEPVSRAVEMFRREPAWTALAVVEGSRPLGMVRRDQLLTLLSKPLHPEIYNRKPVTSVMDSRAVQIDARARLEQVSRLVTGAADAGGRRDEFIITRHGAYLGLGRMIDLLREITARQIEAARHSNPLTGLPGNVEIQSHLAQWLTLRRPFVVCHLDLDQFKPFNDTYGYARGDQVLQHVASTLVQAARPRVDFVGHIGGDDFVIMLRSQDWSLRLLALLDDLAASLPSFHDPADRLAGRLRGRDRDGHERMFPLLSASVAAVEVTAGEGSSEAVADQLAHAKHAAKALEGNSCVLATLDGRMRDLRHPSVPLAQEAPEALPAPLPELGLQ